MDGEGKPKPENAKVPADFTIGDQPADLEGMTKEQLLAEAEKRGVQVKPSDNKSEILAALKAAQQPAA